MYGGVGRVPNGWPIALCALRIQQLKIATFN